MYKSVLPIVFSLSFVAMAESIPVHFQKSMSWQIVTAGNGTILMLLVLILVQPLATWVMIPQDIRTQESASPKRICSFIALIWLRVFMGSFYASIPGLPLVRQQHLQWSLAIMLPLLKKVNMWWNSKYSLWAFDTEREALNIENVVFIGCQHSFSLTIVLSSGPSTSWWTVYILILSDTMMNAWSFKNIIRLHKQGTDAANELRDTSLRCLALKEFLEILIPTVYCLAFTGSYLGPNYEIIGGVGSDIWHHEKVTNLTKKLQKIVIFMTLEFLRGIGFGVALFKFFKLNLYSGYCYVIRNYGWLLLFTGALQCTVVNGNYLLSLKNILTN